MSIEALAESICGIAADYRIVELGPFTPEHVIHWIEQFDADERLVVLSELKHVFEKTYFSEVKIKEFLKDVATEEKLVGADPAAFWRAAGILKVQLGGASQAEMLVHFDGVLNEHLGIALEDCQPSSDTFIYVDDAVFSGNRVRNDLKPWIENLAPKKATVHVLVLAIHSNGEYYAHGHLQQAATAVGKEITIKWWRATTIENQKFNRNKSEVFWPCELPDDPYVAQYVGMLTGGGYPPTLRARGETPKEGIFSSEDGRAALEKALLRAGARARSLCANLPQNARPLGYTPLRTLGFGSTIVTFRNCPNSCPLPFWAGAPWYPLFRRKTN